MSAATVSPPVLCLGDAIVELVCEQPVRSLSRARGFTPHFGGTVATAAVVAARAGASVAIAGAAGQDEWGRWLADRLAAEGVDADRFVLVDGAQTQLAFVAVDGDGVPARALYAPPIAGLRPSLGEGIEAAVDAAAGLLIGADCLAGEAERTLAMRARARAVAVGRPIVLDADLRLDRFTSRTDARASANACVAEATLVRAGQADAELMTGEADPERAALALRKAGAKLVAINLAGGGAILRGVERAEAPPAPARVRSSIGADGHFTGTLVARLALSGFYPASAAAAIGEATRAGAAACERWGALD